MLVQASQPRSNEVWYLVRSDIEAEYHKDVAKVRKVVRERGGGSGGDYDRFYEVALSPGQVRGDDDVMVGGGEGEMGAPESD